MSWVFVGTTVVSTGLGMYNANRAEQAQEDAMNATGSVDGFGGPGGLNPFSIGSASLNAQGQLAPGVLDLNRLWGPQFSGASNQNTLSALFGSPAQAAVPATPAPGFQAPQGWSNLTPDVQQYLQNQYANGNNFQGGSAYDNMLSIYRGLGNSVGTAAQNDAFNAWTNQFGPGWGQDGGAQVNNLLNAGFQAQQANVGTAGKAAVEATPGVVDMYSQINDKLNPGYAASLDQLGKAAGVAPATITAPTVGQSPAAGQINALLGQTAPQVTAPTGANPGQASLQNLINQPGYTSITGAQVGPAGGVNQANAPQTAMAGIAPLAAQAQAANVGQAAQSMAPVQVQAPSSFQQLFGTNVSGPSSFQQVNAPAAVGNVAANTNYQNISAPNLGLSQITAGNNSTLNNLASQGFNANRPIQQQLESQASQELANGGELSADQIRMAQQASRAAFGARGMAGSNGAIIDEVNRQLTRSNELLNQRRNFAAGVENQGFGQLATQQGIAANVAGLQNQYLGLGLDAQKANNQNLISQGQLGLSAAQSNQAAGLESNRLGLQAGMANQSTGLQNNALNMQGQIANQNAGLDLSRLGLQAQQSNQSNALAVGQSNQNAGLQLSQLGLQAGIANQGAPMQNQQFNAGAINQNNQLNAQLLNSANQFNAGQTNATGQFNAGQIGQNNQFNAGQVNANSQFNAGQADTAAARALAVAQANAQMQQQANLANQSAQQTAYGQQLGASSDLGNLFNAQAQLGMQAQQSNQNAYLTNQGQNFNALQSLMQGDNQMAQFNATNGMNAAQFNAGQQQQAFQNQLAYQQAVAQGKIDPMALLGFANGQQTAGMFDPFDPAIMSMYAGNANNSAQMQMAAANNAAARSAANTNAIASVIGSGLQAYSAYAACWVAREVYTDTAPAWTIFREWLFTKANSRRVARYLANGEKIAQWLKCRPDWKARVRLWMDAKLAEQLALT